MPLTAPPQTTLCGRAPLDQQRVDEHIERDRRRCQQRRQHVRRPPQPEERPDTQRQPELECMTCRDRGARQRPARGALHQLVDVGVRNAVQRVGPAAASIAPISVLTISTGPPRLISRTAHRQGADIRDTNAAQLPFNGLHGGPPPPSSAAPRPIRTAAAPSRRGMAVRTENQLPKLNTRVRFPSSAPDLAAETLFERVRTGPQCHDDVTRFKVTPAAFSASACECAYSRIVRLASLCPIHAAMTAHRHPRQVHQGGARVPGRVKPDVAHPSGLHGRHASTATTPRANTARRPRCSPHSRTRRSPAPTARRPAAPW
jgi:hypothetical protein